MTLHCGIVGLPNVGKSTLFNALTKSTIAAENYPFCTINPNVGVVYVPDSRINRLAEIVLPQRVLPTAIEFVDIAGLVAGASKGEGLGNKFLANIRENDAIIHVVRCFKDDNVTHVSGKIDPIYDIEVINTELVLADITTVEKALQRLAKTIKTGDKYELKKMAVLKKASAHLDSGKPARLLDLTTDETKILKEYCLITLKPTLYIANVQDNKFANNLMLDKVKLHAKTEGSAVVPVCATVEAEIAHLNGREKEEFLEALGLAESGLNRVVKASYELLKLATYFTAGTKEVRAWTIPVQATANKAAGIIHTDFEKGFIRAEVISYQDFIQHNGEQGAKDAGKWRLEGKDYNVQDGDVIHFRFSV